MAEYVGSLEYVKLGNCKYLFILLNTDAYESRVQDEIDKQWVHFGIDLKDKGAVKQPVKESLDDVASELESKPWPQEVKKRLQGKPGPYMLVINRDFKEFDPTHDRYAFFWFTNLDSEGHVGKVADVFREIAAKAKSNEDLFKFVHALNRKVKSHDFSGYVSITLGPIAFDPGKILGAVSKKFTKE